MKGGGLSGDTGVNNGIEVYCLARCIRFDLYFLCMLFYRVEHRGSQRDRLHAVEPMGAMFGVWTRRGRETPKRYATIKAHCAANV